MYDELNGKGFEILAFPSNQFGNQEPGTAEEINAFAREKYGAKFPIHAKIEVNGKNTHPIFNFLRSNSELLNPVSGLVKNIPWNFAKFLVDGEGKVIAYHPPTTDPLSLKDQIEAKL